MLDARACAPNQVQFLTFSEGAVYGASVGATACGQCVPGRHGNWRIHGAEPFAVGASVQQCTMTDMAGLQCSALNFPEPQRSPAYSCALNEYCDDAGSCRAMKLSPLYNQVCGSGANCGPGLHCLAGRCRICARDHPQFRYRGPLGVRFYFSHHGHTPQLISRTRFCDLQFRSVCALSCRPNAKTTSSSSRCQALVAESKVPFLVCIRQIDGFYVGCHFNADDDDDFDCGALV